MVELPNVRLNLRNSADNVLLVREMLSGVGEAVDVGGEDLDQIRTAVTEACNNVVLHAYERGSGPLEVEVYLATAAAIEVVVRDRGNGTSPQPRAATESALPGIGLSVIEALVRRVEFSDSPGGGTQVRMEFATPGSRALQPVGDDGLAIFTTAQTHDTTATKLAIGPPQLARRVLSRVLTVLAAHAQFSTDRIFDVQNVVDTLVAHARDSVCASHLTAAVTVAPHELALRLGPLAEGGARRLTTDAAVDGHEELIEMLTDDRHVAIVDSHEMLALRLVDRSVELR
jgi:serine/threonine-protein kinase RsbW